MKIKKVLIYSAITLLMIIVVLLVLPFVVNLDKYISKITGPASKAVGRQVSIDHLRLTILTGLGVELKGVSVAETKPSKTPFVHIEGVDVGVKLLPLLKKEIAISKVIITKPDINIIRYADGTYNFSDLMKKTSEKPTETTAAKPEEKGGTSGIPKGFSLGKLAITDGRVSITDIDNKKEHSYVIDHINLGVQDFNVTKPFKVSLGVTFGNLKDARLDVNGMVGPIGEQLSPETLPLNIKVSMKHIDIPYMISLAGQKKQVLKSGTLDVEEALKSKAGVTDINGRIGLSGLALTNATIAAVNITDNLQFHSDKKQLSINDITVQSQGIDLGLKGDADISGKSAHISLFSRKLPISGLLDFYSPLKQMLPQDMDISGNGSIKTDVTADGSTMGIKGIVDLTNARIGYQSGKQKMFAKPDSVPFSLSYDISKQSSYITMKDVKLVLDKLSVVLTGKMLASGSMDGDVSINSNTIQLQTMEDIVPLIKSYNASGNVALSARAKGAFKNPKELAVTGSLQVKNVSAQISSLPKPLKSFDMNASFTRNSLALKSMTAQIGQSVIKASGDVTDFSAPHGRFNIASPYLNIDELMPASKQEKKPEEPAKAGQAKEQQQPSIMDKADITVNANVKKGIVKKALFSDLTAVARIVKGSLILDKFNVRAFSGVLAANGTVGMKGEEPYNLKLKTTELNLGDMLNTFTSYKDIMSGRLGTDVALHGNAKELKQTVSGNGVITVTNGEIKTFSVLSKLTDIARLANIGTGNTTRIKNMKLTGSIDNGKITTNDLKLISDDVNVNANGYFDLDSNLNYHGTGIFSRSLSTRVGGTTGQLIKNEQGEVEVPFTLTGDIKRPVFKLDQAAFEQRLKEVAKKKVIQELNKQLNKELQTNKPAQQLQQNIQEKGKKAIEQLFR